MEKSTITSEYRPTLNQAISNLVKAPRRHGFLILQLLKVNLLSDFKKSFIGALWLFILPVLNVITWTILHQSGVIEPGGSTLPYPVYVLLSTSIWTFFIGIFRLVSKTITSNGRLMIMVALPVEVFIFENIIVHIIQFTILMVINILALWYFDINLPLSAILFPLALIPLLFLGMALGLINSLFKVVAVDLARIFDSLMGFLMYITPIIYTPKIEVGFLSKIIPLNPLTYLIGTPRDLLTSKHYELDQSYLTYSLFSFILFMLCFLIFKRAVKRTTERIIST